MLSDNEKLDAHVQHSGEGIPSPGNSEALKTTLVVAGAGVNELVKDGSMGLKGMLDQIGNATAMTINCAIMVYGIVYVVPQMQDKFNAVVNAEREAHTVQINAERTQAAVDRQLDREMYDKQRLLIEDRADARHEKMEANNDTRFDKLSDDIMRAIKDVLAKPK